MNHTLSALMKKLKGQLEENQQQSHSLLLQLEAQEKNIKLLQKSLQEACNIPSQVHPEQEIARLNFTLQYQEMLAQCNIKNQEDKTVYERLKKQEMRIKIELAALEKYEKRNQEKKRLEMLTQQNKELDTWVLQRRAVYES